ncbi:MAG: galactose-binding domain-containing protein [Planctomycetota bacterium]|jgi:hypothetical protein
MSKKLMYLFSAVVVMGLAVSVSSAQPLNQDPGPDGIVSVEAEHFDANVEVGGHTWELTGPTGGFTGEFGMHAPNPTHGGHSSNYAANSERLEYEINFVKTGTHYVWILAWGESGSDDSCHVGLDGEETPDSSQMSGWNNNYAWDNGRYQFSGVSQFEVSTLGVHTLNLWVREDGLIVDKIVLTTNPDFSLSGNEPGPPESSRGARVIAFGPNPGDGATDVPRDVTLSWEAGALADTHDVYFGTVFDDVNNADRTDPRTVLAKQGQVETSYTPPQRLDFVTTYYWRIDEVNAPPDNTIRKGDVWGFTTEPFSYQVQSVTATASSSSVEKGPENVVNGSGLDSSGLHGNTGEGNMWLSDIAGPQPAWIQFEFDTVHKLHEMLVWNSNESLESVIGLGFKDVTIEYSADGVDFLTLGTTHEFAQAPGTAGYASNTTIDMTGVSAKYVKLTANSNWKSILPQFGLSEVQFFSLPVQAREPNPASRATEVALDLDLTWRAGREAAVHDVYFSEDWEAVIDGNAPVTTVTETSHGPLALDLGKTYYWRVDEVNDVETPSAWQGDIWSFTTHEYFVVDDMESYNDIQEGEEGSNRIYNAWVDGYNDPTNGSQVGHLDPPFYEETIVHGDNKSMPIYYDNAVSISEATMTLSSLRDWTLRGAGELSLWFKGNPAGFSEDPVGTFTISAAGDDIWNTADQFRYAYKQLNGAGSITAQVLSVDNTDAWAKCGVMIRQTLDPGSKFAAVYITPGNGCRFQARLTPGASATSDTSVATAEQTAITAPYWIKIERDAADNFNGYYSSDGVSWQAMSWNPQKISMPSNVYIGLAFTSHNTGVIGEAQISDVTTSGAVSPPTWANEAIGVDMASNDPEPLYVALNGNAVVSHENPNASLINDWTEWIIDLQVFADQGVNLTNVNTITIGLGDKSNPQAGDLGIMYFDDIRLYPHREPPVLVPKETNSIFEAESADILGSSWRRYSDPTASGGQNIGSENGDGDDFDTAPGAEWIASYNFTAAADGVYKILLRAMENDSDSFWVRITTATSQNIEDPDQLGTGWVRFNGMEAPNGWAWDEVHNDDPDAVVANWTLAAGEHTLEIAKREDGVLLDAILITDDLALDQTTLP